MQADISLIIRLRQKLFADPRRISLLKQIQHTGSISRGAKLAGISYKSAWDAVNEMNTLAETTLVARATGGKGGGGAVLTPYGERLIKLFDLLEQVQQKAFDALQDDSVPLESLLAAIARISLQTSARNQLYGTLVARQSGHVQQWVDIALADGRTHIRAALTERSADRLQLVPGKEVLLLIKAPWIQLNTGDSDADNQLTATVTDIEHGGTQSEVLLQLESGETLCATLPRDDVERQNLQPGSVTTACFDADRVIVACLL